MLVRVRATPTTPKSSASRRIWWRACPTALRWRDAKPPEKQKLRKVDSSASARMLYEVAKRYDEWEGENYEGSSIRGAMKGWLRHGVCTWGDWPYDEGERGRLTPSRQLRALGHPLCIKKDVMIG